MMGELKYTDFIFLNIILTILSNEEQNDYVLISGLYTQLVRNKPTVKLSQISLFLLMRKKEEHDEHE